MIRFLRLACTILSVGFLTTGYALTNREWQAVGILSFGILWVIGLLRWWKWFPTLSLITTFGMAGVGLFLNISSGIMVSGAMFGFLAWDLAEFTAHLRLSAPEDDTSRLERTHLRRMGIITLVSSGLYGLALVLQLKFSFEWIVLLMFFAVWGIGRIVNRIVRRED